MPQCDPTTQIDAIRHFNASAVTVKVMKLLADKMRSPVFQPLQDKKQFQDFIRFIQDDKGSDFFLQEEQAIDDDTYRYTGRNSLKEHQSTEDDEKLKYEITDQQANTLILKNNKKR